MDEGGSLSLLVALSAPPAPDSYVHVELSHQDLDACHTLELGPSGNLTRSLARRVTLTAASPSATVRLAAPAHGVADGDTVVTLEVAVHSPLYPYNQLQVPSLRLTVRDVDTAALLLGLSHGGSIHVDGAAAASVAVSLASRPPSLVRITLHMQEGIGLGPQCSRSYPPPPSRRISAARA